MDCHEIVMKEAETKNEEWYDNQITLLKNKITRQEGQIKHLENIVAQLISQVTNISNGKWKVNWTD